MHPLSKPNYRIQPSTTNRVGILWAHRLECPATVGAIHEQKNWWHSTVSQQSTSIEKKASGRGYEESDTEILATATVYPRLTGLAGCARGKPLFRNCLISASAMMLCRRPLFQRPQATRCAFSPRWPLSFYRARLLVPIEHSARVNVFTLLPVEHHIVDTKSCLTLSLTGDLV